MFGTKMHNQAENSLLQLLEEELVNQFNDDRQKLREEVKQNIEHTQHIYKRNFDKRRRAEHTYKVGDLVAIKRTHLLTVNWLVSILALTR